MLATSGSGKPSQVNLRRAVSSAYYALFHCLARCCADTLVGGYGADRSRHAWRQVYRALEHGFAKNACTARKFIKKFPQEIQDFAGTFVTMQEKRHAADYDPTACFLKSEVLKAIEATETALKNFRNVPIKDRRAFSAYVLFKKRI
ncbi:MAG: hypothetical protein D6807_08685 [Alphaproteobacteria bacterium]|nr:MAG: hypothetical protein D6807_08685 [Alphaproteobacteria bacterium]